MHKKTTRLLAVFLTAICTTVLVVGCATQKQARDVDLGVAEESGFLDDYSILKRSTGGKNDLQVALYGWVDESVDWASYDKLLLDPIEIWRSQGGAPLEDIQRISNDFYLLLYEELSEDYTMVQSPGPNTLRFDVLMMAVEKGSVALDKVTSIVPVGLGASLAKDFFTGKPLFVGEASIQFKATDAHTGKFLGAGVDRRVGGKDIIKGVDSWSDVQNILRLWSQGARFRLCVNRTGNPGDCPRPEGA